MSTVNEILIRARDTLGDPDKTRWTDESLIRRLNEGAKDIAKKAELFKKTVAIQLVKGQFSYSMPDDFIELKDALYRHEPLDVITSQQMINIYGSDWRLHTTENEVNTIVTDRADAKTIRVYPRPFMDDLYDQYTFDPDTYGVTDTLTGYTFDSAYGLVGSIYDTELIDTDIDQFGIIVEAVEGSYLTVEYVRHPILVVAIFDEIELPDAFDTALVKYIVGTAFRDDIDAQNRAQGNEELVLYRDALNDIIDTAGSSNTTIQHNSTVEYRGMG